MATTRTSNKSTNPIIGAAAFIHSVIAFRHNQILYQFCHAVCLILLCFHLIQKEFYLPDSGWSSLSSFDLYGHTCSISGCHADCSTNSRCNRCSCRCSSCLCRSFCCNLGSSLGGFFCCLFSYRLGGIFGSFLCCLFWPASFLPLPS